MLFYIHIMQSDVLRFFIEDRDIDGWREIAFNWLMVSILIAVVSALSMLAIKWMLKRSAGVIRKQAWSRGKTIGFMLIGFVPIFLLALIFWFASRDFKNIVGVPGFANGVLLAGLLYSILILIGHLGRWRRDIF